MIRMKNSLLVNEEFSRLLRSLSGHKIPVSAGLKLLKAYKALETERAVVLESRNDLIKRYGVKDGKGGISIPPSDAEGTRAFNRDFGELMALECELPIAERIPLPGPILDKDGAEMMLSVLELAMLSEIIDFGESP